MRVSLVSSVLLAAATLVSALPIGPADIFGRDYIPTRAEPRSLPVGPVPPIPPRPSASPSSGAHYFPRAFVPLAPTLPLGTPNDLARCPAHQLACPVDVVPAGTDSSDAEYECVSPDQDLYSCGGCSTLGTGTDCTALPGVQAVTCAAAQCQVHSCKTGYMVSPTGDACLPALAIFS